jgi:hypothetical protein
MDSGGGSSGGGGEPKTQSVGGSSAGGEEGSVDASKEAVKKNAGKEFGDGSSGKKRNHSEDLTVSGGDTKRYRVVSEVQSISAEVREESSCSKDLTVLPNRFGGEEDGSSGCVDQESAVPQNVAENEIHILQNNNDSLGTLRSVAETETDVSENNVVSQVDPSDFDEPAFNFDDDSPPSDVNGSPSAQVDTIGSLPLTTVKELVAFNVLLGRNNNEHLIAHLALLFENLEPESVKQTTRIVTKNVFSKCLLNKISYEGTPNCFSQKWSEEEHKNKFRFALRNLDKEKRIQLMLRGKLRW